jgi:hypothetical protein
VAPLARAWRALRRSPFEATLALTAIGVSLWVVATPLLSSRYPPMTDLPFHAAFGGVFRHYWDPSYHLREQFDLTPFSRPYMSMYGLIAALMLALPMMTAVKIAAAVHLLLVPAGLAVLCHGAKKSPLLGLLGLGLCWGNLTHVGFLNYVGALGLLAMSVGAALLVVDRPTRGRKIGLALSLGALYFTHIFRYPFALAAVAGTGVVMYPATRRLRPLALPLSAGVALFAAWLALRPRALAGPIELGFHPERLLAEIGPAITGGFKDEGPARALLTSFDACWAVAGVAAGHALLQRLRGRRRFTAWDVGVTVVPLACAAVFLGLFLVLPLWIGEWFYVYPREATAAAIILCGACPDLPRPRWLRLPLVAAMSLAAAGVSRQVASHYAEFSQTAEDFHAITRRIPRAPRLFYDIADHTGSSRTVSPFSHLAAYVQAEKGGWLSWSFATWEALPVVYRRPGDPEAVPIPSRPPRWDARVEAPFYDWILVRQDTPPDRAFVHDPAIRRVDHVGKWWLYHRVPAP